MVIRKRKELGTSIKKDDYSAFELYKQQGHLNWDEINHSRFDYLYNICHFTDGMIADLFDVEKRTVTKKRKELGITQFDTLFPNNALNDVSSYLDFICMQST